MSIYIRAIRHIHLLDKISKIYPMAQNRINKFNKSKIYWDYLRVILNILLIIAITISPTVTFKLR